MHSADPHLEYFIEWVESLLGHNLHDYQKDAIRFLWSTPKSALFADVGLGKAIMALMVIYRAVFGLDTGQALVIAPIRVAKQTWPTEIREWQLDLPHTLIRAEDSDDDVKACYDAHRIRFVEAATALGLPAGLRSRWAAKHAQVQRDRFKQDKRRRLANTPTPLHVIGLPQVEWLVQHHGKRWPYRTVVIDESSAFKDFSTKRWKAVNSVFKYIDRMHILTASPAAESWLDIWAQIGLLDRGERLGRRITWYRETFFNHDQYTYSYELKTGAQEQISEKISDICMVMKAEDHLPLEKPLMLTRPVELNDSAIALYDSFVQDYVLSLPEAEIEAVSGGVLINKLLQFTGGAVLDEDRNLHEIHTDKIDELRELIDELQGEPLMVAYWYQSSLKRLKKAFPNAVVMDKSGKAVDAWNAGKIPLLLIHPASAGHGLNMQKGPGHDLAFFDLCWSRELYEQIIGRLARQGQRKVVRVHHLVVKRADDGVKRSARQQQERWTADEIVMAALHEKGEGQALLFRFIREMRKRLAAKTAAVVQQSDSDGDDL